MVSVPTSLIGLQNKAVQHTEGGWDARRARLLGVAAAVQGPASSGTHEAEPQSRQRAAGSRQGARSAWAGACINTQHETVLNAPDGP